MTKKLTALALVVCLCMSLLTGCGLNIGKLVSVYKYFSDKKNYPDNRIAEIIDAADKEDADALYEMFSSNIVGLNENLHEEAEAFVEAIDGEFVSCDVKYEEESSSSRDHNGIKTQILALVEVELTTGKYMVDIIENTEVYDEKYKGIQSLGFQEYDDYEEDPCFAPDYGGIYVVTPDNHEEIIELENESYTPEFSTLQARILEEAGLDADSPDDLTDRQKEDLEAMEEMLSYAQDKYLETFNYMGYIEPGNTELQEEEMILCPELGDIYTDCFSVKRDGDGFTDDYMCVVVRGMTQKYIQDYVSGLIDGGEVRVFADVSSTTITDKTFAEEDIPGNVNASCMIFVDGAGVSDETAAELPGKVQAWLEDQEIYGLNQLIVLNDGEIDLVGTMNYTDFLSDEYYRLREDCDAQ